MFPALCSHWPFIEPCPLIQVLYHTKPPQGQTSDQILACWANLGPVGGYVELVLGHSGLCWANLGPFGGYVGPMLGLSLASRSGQIVLRVRLGVLLALCWAVGGLVLGHLAAMLSLCWAIWGPC